MTERIQAKRLEQMMLHDAILWQASYFDAVRGTDGEAEARDLLKQYRALYKRRYGDTKTNSIKCWKVQRSSASSTSARRKRHDQPTA